MTTSKTSFNGLETFIIVVVPTLALAGYLTHMGASLGDFRALLAAAFLGLVSAVAHFATVRLLQKSFMRDEVVLQTCLRIALSIGVAVAVGKAFVG